MQAHSVESLIPPDAHDLIRAWTERYRASYSIVPVRKSKLGDCRYSPANKSSLITLNRDPNPYRFLITLVHELAHARVNLELPFRVAPHGKEWKSAVREMMFEIKALRVFPYDVEVAIERHFLHPQYTDTIDPLLTDILAQYDQISAEA